jgi:hypothetical protein
MAINEVDRSVRLLLKPDDREGGPQRRFVSPTP